MPNFKIPACGRQANVKGMSKFKIKKFGIWALELIWYLNFDIWHLDAVPV